MIRFTTLLLLHLLAYLSFTQILAIDYGTQFIKAALVHTGAGKSFSIVENPKSQRKFTNAVPLH
jgi:molecular chaperone DnaK (HSP70)